MNKYLEKIASLEQLGKAVAPLIKTKIPQMQGALGKVNLFAAKPIGKASMAKAPPVKV